VLSLFMKRERLASLTPGSTNEAAIDLAKSGTEKSEQSTA